MKNRKTILFIINNQIVGKSNEDLYLNQIDEHCWVIASEMEVSINEVTTEIVELDACKIDVSNEGMFVWDDVNYKILTGVKCLIDVWSDEYMDAVHNNTLDEYLVIN